MVRGCLGLVECWCDTHEEGSAVGSAEHAGEYSKTIGLELFKDVTTFRHPDAAAIFCISHPNGSFRIETDPIGRDIHLTKKLTEVWSMLAGRRRVPRSTACPAHRRRRQKR